MGWTVLPPGGACWLSAGGDIYASARPSLNIFKIGRTASAGKDKKEQNYVQQRVLTSVNYKIVTKICCTKMLHHNFNIYIIL